MALIDQFPQFLADTAMEAAARYVKLHDVKYDADELLARIRTNLKANLDNILADAKQAYEAKMIQEMQAIVKLSAMDCGVQAAKSFERV